MIALNREQICSLHADLVEAFGGTLGVRDERMLDSALAAPYASFGGSEVFPTLISKAARLGFGLVANHPFFDGNKRIGVHAMLVFLALNGVEVQADNDEVVRVGLALGEGTMGVDELVRWIESHGA